MITTLLILSIAANILLVAYAMTYRDAFLELVEDLGQAWDQLDQVSSEAGLTLWTEYGEADENPMPAQARLRGASAYEDLP